MTTTAKREPAWPQRTANRARNRAALLQAAREQLERGGYAGCSVEAVANSAGLTKGAVYSIFGSKAELVLESLRPRWQAPSLDELSDTPGDLSDLLDAYGRAWGDLAHLAGSRVALELALEIQLAAVRDPAVAVRFQEMFEAERTALAAQLTAAAQTRAQPLPCPAEEFVLVLLAALQGLLHTTVLLQQSLDEAAFGAVARRLLER
jgi:AcrR family transcriptional regulator